MVLFHTQFIILFVLLFYRNHKYVLNQWKIKKSFLNFHSSEMCVVTLSLTNFPKFNQMTKEYKSLVRKGFMFPRWIFHCAYRHTIWQNQVNRTTNYEDQLYNSNNFIKKKNWFKWKQSSLICFINKWLMSCLLLPN